MPFLTSILNSSEGRANPSNTYTARYTKLNKMTNINLEDYKPVIDTTKLSDDEIELWFSSKHAIKLLRLIEGCDLDLIKFNSFGIDCIDYYKDKKTMMSYFFESKRMILSIDWYELGLKNENYQIVTKELTRILNIHFLFEIKEVK